jgi:hypothetical protein
MTERNINNFLQPPQKIACDGLNFNSNGYVNSNMGNNILDSLAAGDPTSLYNINFNNDIFSDLNVPLLTPTIPTPGNYCSNKSKLG